MNKDDPTSLFGPHVWRGGNGRTTATAVPTGFAALDRALPGGGWPQGALIELYAAPGSGEMSLLMPAIVRLSLEETDDKKWIAWVAPPLVPYAPALRRYGVDVDRMLMIRPSRGVGARDCLWAAEQVIRSGASSGVLAWLPPADTVALRRLQLAAEEQCCWTVLFREPAALAKPSPAALRLRLRHEREGMCVDVLKCRGGRPASIDITAALASMRHADPAGVASEASR